MNKRKDHWEKVYESKKPGEVSWFQLNPIISLDLIASTGVAHDQKIIDVGGGASVLVDKLLEKEFQTVTVLDISAKAIRHAKERLAELADKINWIEADVTQVELPHQYDLWHDRAVFHFLTDPDDRKKYVEAMKKFVRTGGHVIIATFALEGPSKCSGLNVERYDEGKLARAIGKHFKLINSVHEEHETPWKSNQEFIYGYFRKMETEKE